MAISIRRLQANDLLDSFDCGDEALNNYLKKHAWNNQQKSSIGVTYVAIEQSSPRSVLGFFTLAAGSCARAFFPKKQVRGLPYYDLPMILLARLGVDLRFAGQGLGKALLREAFQVSSTVAEHIGCRYMVVDAYATAVQWYQHLGFVPMEGGQGDSTRMYLDIRTLKESTV